MTVVSLYSRFVNGGQPKRCAYCRAHFDTAAYRGENGKYYCAPLCRETDQASNVEERSRQAS